MQNDSSTSEATRNLDLLLRRRWVIAAGFLATILATIALTWFRTPIYQSSALLLIEKERGGGAALANGVLVENSNEDYYQTQYRMLKSESLLGEVYRRLELDKVPEFANPKGVQRLDRSIIISAIARSRLVYVRAEATDPRLATSISNTLAQTFVEQNLGNQLFISKEVLRALQVDRENPGDRSIYEALPAVVGNQLLQTLKAEYAKLQAQAANLSAQYTGRHPAMQAMRANMAALRGQIEGETDKIVQSVRTELSGQLRGNNVRIVDPATQPDSPIRPQRVRAALMGAFLGVLIGLMLAVLVEALDQTIRSEHDVESKLERPFLGMIPEHPKTNDVVYTPLIAPQPSLTSEGFRNLRTLVDLASAEGRSKAIMVTSTVQEEGKTYVSSNLAVAFAQLGEKVLIIDGDLRRPRIHSNFRISSRDGLSQYLASASKAEDAAQYIQPTQVPGLSALPCGPRPPNPAELLNTPRLAALIAWSMAHYDRVVVDCTPMFPISDTLLLGRHVRSCVFTVRFGITRAPLVRTALQRLESGGVKLLGVAINGATAGGLTYAGSGYYYQYYRSYKEAADPIVRA